MGRRASLPGVDALFGTSAAPHAPGQTASDEVTADDEVLRGAIDTVRQIVAPEEPALRAAWEAAEALAPPSPEVGALLRWAATGCRARTVVEIGSAGGVSGLWLLAGMAEGGVLTSLEPDAEAHTLAAKAFGQAGARVRSIQGEVATLLSRLADDSYDLVLLQTDRGHYPEHLERTRALLRSGGMLVARGVLPVGRHQEAMIRFLHELVDDAAFSATVLPVDDGVAIAHRLPDPEA